MGPGESFALPCIYTVATKKRGDFSSLSFSDPGEIYPKRGQVYCLSTL